MAPLDSPRSMQTGPILAFTVVALLSAIPHAAAATSYVEASPPLDPNHVIAASGAADPHVTTPADIDATGALRHVQGVNVQSPDVPVAPDTGRRLTGSPTYQPPASAVIGTAMAVAVLGLVFGNLKGVAVLGVGGPLFSRIAAKHVLENHVRSRIHECVRSNPGVTIKEVTTLLEVGWGNTVYHLRRLENEGLIVSERHRQFRRFYANGGVPADRLGVAELKNPTAHRLGAEIVNRPGTGQKDLCEAIGISAPRAHKHLARLEDAQLLTKQRQWKAVSYFPTDKLVSLLSSDDAPSAHTSNALAA